MRYFIETNGNNIFTNPAKVVALLQVYAVSHGINYHGGCFRAVTRYKQYHQKIVKSIAGTIDVQMGHDEAVVRVQL